MWEELGYKYLVMQSLGIVATCQDIVYLKKVNVGFHTYYLHLFVSAFFLSPNLCFFLFCFFFFSRMCVGSVSVEAAGHPAALLAASALCLTFCSVW